MVLVLCIGDLHIPHRASDLPPKLKDLLQPGKVHQVLCPGNLCSREVLDYLKSVCGTVHLTRGDFDDIVAPEDKIVTIENFKVGLCHGHQVVPAGDVEALGIMLRRMDVDILITGYTHKFQVEQYENCLIMNPGSATGAYSMFQNDVVPSFALMDINGSKVNVYIYEMIEGEIKIRKMEYVKPSGPGVNSQSRLSEPSAGSPLRPPEVTKPSVPDPSPTPAPAPAPAPEPISALQQATPAPPEPAKMEKVSSEPTPHIDELPQIATMGSDAVMGPEATPKPEVASEPLSAKPTPPPIPSPDDIDEVTFGDIDDGT